MVKCNCSDTGGINMGSSVDQLSVGSNIANISVAIIAFVSALIAWLSFLDSKKRQKRANAIKLSKYYQEYILKESSYINKALENSDFASITKKCFLYEKIGEFNSSEMSDLIKQQNIGVNLDYISNKYNEIPIEKIASATLAMQNLEKNSEKIKLYCKLLNDDTNPKSKSYIEINLREELIFRIKDLLNVLEWFSMNFISGVADEKTVYQSLHQTFLGQVHQLYYFISINNEEEHNKYFTNIINLFNIWAEREREIKFKEKILKIERKKEDVN